MKKFVLVPYAVVGLGLVAWWAFTQSAIPLVGILFLLVVAAVHVVKYSSAPGSVSTEHDKVEGHARATFPMPPERGRGI